MSESALKKPPTDINEFDAIVDQIMVEYKSLPPRLTSEEIATIINSGFTRMGYGLPSRKKIGSSLTRLRHSRVSTKVGRDWVFSSLPAYPSSRD